ncbi:MAG: signal peptidase I [Eubacterium sp.]|nr:signal peptidase I [Eubacterium sp.]
MLVEEEPVKSEGLSEEAPEGQDEENKVEKVKSEVKSEKKLNKKKAKQKKQEKELELVETYNESHSFARGLISIIFCALVALGLSILITKFVAHHTSVEGRSMESSLNNGDQLIVENVSYWFADPKRFDVVIFPYNHSQVNYVKRVIGLPGETVQIDNGKVYIDSKVLETDTYCKEEIEDAGIAEEPIHLGEDEYFVLGDNRNGSTDSRSEDVGLITRDEIEGKAWLRFYPFSDFSIIK